MSDMKCKLKFYMTSLSNIILNENEYDCPGSITVMGRYYLVMYEGELWPGQVTQVKSGGQIITVKCLEKIDAPKGSTWKWSVKKDEHDYPICDVKQKIERPQLYTMFQFIIFLLKMIFNSNFLSIQTKETKMRQDSLGKESS